jgi:hypothetical protein
MKKIVFVLAIMAAAFVSKGFAQEAGKDISLPEMLPGYYAIKDALVSSNATLASDKASEFVGVLNKTTSKTTASAEKASILTELKKIASTKDLEKQRSSFSKLSTGMVAVVKSTATTPAEPVYQFFCPMKKTVWLSNKKEVKNPYYGSAMLTCGSIVD